MKPLPLKPRFYFFNPPKLKISLPKNHAQRLINENMPKDYLTYGSSMYRNVSFSATAPIPRYSAKRACMRKWGGGIHKMNLR